MSTVSPAAPKSRNWWPLLKWSLFLIVLAAVVQQGYRLWGQVDIREVTLRPGWLLLAMLAYLCGWLPSVWYWRQLLLSRGDRVPWLELLRAYYCSHLGKYIPGKAAVLVIRAVLVKPAGVPLSAGIVTAGYESLAMIAAGGAIGAALAPLILAPGTLRRWLGGGEWTAMAPILLPIVVLVGCLLGLPILSRAMNVMLGKLLPPMPGSDTTPPLAMKASAWGFLLLIGGWWLHGLSLGCTIQAISTESISLADWPRWTAGASLATVLGFAVLFAPGGMGVREGVLMEILSTQISPARAVLAAVLLRVVWLTAETGAAAVFYYAFAPARKDSPAHAVDHRPGVQ